MADSVVYTNKLLAVAVASIHPLNPVNWALLLLFAATLAHSAPRTVDGSLDWHSALKHAVVPAIVASAAVTALATFGSPFTYTRGPFAQ